MARDRRAKFVELAQNRVNKAISHIRLIGNLANRTNYEFDDEDARKIVKALQRELDALKAKFGDSGSSSSTEFKL
jgi:ABC-type Fe3+-hydroxamate transport system substrate-binding protein